MSTHGRNLRPTIALTVLCSCVLSCAAHGPSSPSIGDVTDAGVGQDAVGPDTVLDSPAIFVSPSGNDRAQGSRDSPFKTIEHAQTAARAFGNARVTIYLRAGTYNLTHPLTLDVSGDQNKTWSSYPGEIAILDGAGSVDTGVMIREPGITVQRLTVQKFKRAGIDAANVSNILITGNRVLDITSPNWQDVPGPERGASILMWHDPSSAVIGNYVHGNTAFGLSVHSMSTEIHHNSVHNTCSVDSDCGAIYVTGQDALIHENTIGNFGDSRHSTVGIYLDVDMSGARVQRNTLYGPGSWAVVVHGGRDDVFTNNICDLSQISQVGKYQDCPAPTCNTGSTNMGGNLFANNIVYSTSSMPDELWHFYDSGSHVLLPSVHTNLYFDNRGTLPNSGPIYDTAPIYSDPKFFDVLHHDYGLPMDSPAKRIGF
jgi:hypothetical protein